MSMTRIVTLTMCSSPEPAWRSTVARLKGRPAPGAKRRVIHHGECEFGESYWDPVGELEVDGQLIVSAAPGPAGCSRLPTPGNCWRHAWVLAACGFPGEGPLAVPTLWQPVARRQLADPEDMSTTDGGGPGQGQLLDPVVQTLPTEPACRGAGGVCRGKRLVADQPHWPQHQR
jgi:hypothetical protein